MIGAVVVTVGLLPLYLWVRRPYQRLPLHIDTGFYVSNHTVTTGRFEFDKGWNARFAGCSKAVPEAFYSMVYLRRCRPSASGGGVRYRNASRLYASLFNYVSAILFGMLAAVLAGGDVRYYYAGLVLFACLSSEPQYGVYYECGELFGLPLTAVSLLLLSVGLDRGDTVWIGAGVFVWTMEAYFVKLSSGLALAVVCGAVLIWRPTAWAVVTLGGGAASLAYAAWMLRNGTTPTALLRPLLQHEAHYGQRAQWRMLLNRFCEKVRCCARTVRRQPLIPVLAVFGATAVWPAEPLVWVYLVAVSLAYVVQAADCWYYQVPLLGPLVLLAAPAVVVLAADGWGGWMVVVAGAAMWVYHNAVRPRRRTVAELTAWCWNGQAGVEYLTVDQALEDGAPEIAELVRGRSLLVYGPCTQSYVLFGAAYDTAIVTPECYLDEMSPGWQRELNASLIEAPPEFVLDTSRSFDGSAARTMLGLDYCAIHEPGFGLRLYRLASRVQPGASWKDARTFSALPVDTAAAETSSRDAAVTRDADLAGRSLPGPMHADEPARALAALLQELAQVGCERVAVYGAGRFTSRHADVYRSAPLEIVAVLDDRADRLGGGILGFPVGRLEDWARFTPDAVVVSTDRFERVMASQAKAACGGRVPVFTLRDGAAPCLRVTAAETDSPVSNIR